MDLLFSRSITILPSQLDVDGKLSVPATFDLFMDVATQAADAMGVGWAFLMKKGLFWITVKTKIRFINRPGILQRVTVSTWPEAPKEMRCDRHYEIRSESGEVLVTGRTEWAIVSALTRRPQRMDKVLPQGLVYDHAPACPGPFPMIDEAIDDAPFARHTVSTLDIDMARHMNNVAYVRAIVNAFSVKAWKKLNVREMDVIFRVSAREGDELSFRQRRTDDGLDIVGALPDGRVSVLSRLITD